MATIAAIVSIVASLLVTGQAVHMGFLNSFNSNIRNKVKSWISDMTKVLKQDKSLAYSILNRAKNANASTLSTYLYQNPVVSQTLDDISKASEQIGEYELELSNLEIALNNIQNEINSLGYAATHKGAKQEEEHLNKLNQQSEQYRKEYRQVVDKLSNVNASGSRRAHINTRDLDARAQNISGGITNAKV